ncbi:hypothetical protein ES704_02180 [subsurface metagenome]|jgi:hypothetical protein
MKTEMGEYIVGACLKLLKGCDLVDYNVRRPGGGLVGLDELDVMGLDFKNRTAYLCEVTTHLDGLLYGSSKITTAKRIRTKYLKMQEYADNYLSDYFADRHFMFWSPVVRPGVRDELKKIKGLELVINETYAEYIGQLQEFAKKATYDTGNPATRMLQILGHLRRD